MQHLLQRGARRVNREIQYQQRGGEAEHAVAESFHPVLAKNPAPAQGVFVSWHGTASFASADRRRLPREPGRWIQAVCRDAGQHGSSFAPPAAVVPCSSARQLRPQAGVQKPWPGWLTPMVIRRRPDALHPDGMERGHDVSVHRGIDREDNLIPGRY